MVYGVHCSLYILLFYYQLDIKYCFVKVLYERWTIGMYNIFFTSAPPVALGLFDRFNFEFNKNAEINNSEI